MAQADDVPHVDIHGPCQDCQVWHSPRLLPTQAQGPAIRRLTACKHGRPLFAHFTNSQPIALHSEVRESGASQDRCGM